MKHIFKIILLATFFSQGAFAASCGQDKAEMYNQISQFDSISTLGCQPKYGWGISQVLNVVEKGALTCSAECVYVLGQRNNCDWIKGNWGKTLNCY